jgi:putative lipoprotein
VKSPIVLLAVAVAVAGCTTHGGREGRPLAGTHWRLVTINGHPAVGGKAALTISPEGRIGGNASCNAIFGHATVNGNTVAFEMIGSTKMACVDTSVMKQEHAFMDALHLAASWRIEDGRLYLIDRARTDVLEFEAK